MICDWLSAELLGFLRRSATAMGCFFRCFGFRDARHSHPRFVAPNLPSIPTEAAASKNSLSSLLFSEEKRGSPNGEKTPELVDMRANVDIKALRDQVKFLKACGTLPETPSEVRKAAYAIEDSLSSDVSSNPSKFHSWFPDTSPEKLNLEKLADESPTHAKHLEESVNGCGSFGATPSSSITHETISRNISAKVDEEHGLQSDSLTSKYHADQTQYSDPSKSSAAIGQGRNKSVRFDCNLDQTVHSSEGYSSAIAFLNSMKSGSDDNYSVQKPSPYPTPLKLSDQMQTPGTIFPAYLDNIENGKNLRIRSQYVYSVSEPDENIIELKELKEKPSIDLKSGHLGESFEKADDITAKTDLEKKDKLIDEHWEVEAYSMTWSKPPPADQNGSNQSNSSTSSGKSPVVKSAEDRPILGMVAAHWNEEEPSHISPKWWNGNGIPNSTNKYKEDQKVSWHATPFEERLEKALSEENSMCQRKNVDGTSPIDLNENDECDTALSQLQSSNHSKPVVSY